jgi:hypothetical protein
MNRVVFLLRDRMRYQRMDSPSHGLTADAMNTEDYKARMEYNSSLYSGQKST